MIRALSPARTPVSRRVSSALSLTLLLASACSNARTAHDDPHAPDPDGDLDQEESRADSPDSDSDDPDNDSDDPDSDDPNGDDPDGDEGFEWWPIFPTTVLDGEGLTLGVLYDEEDGGFWSIECARGTAQLTPKPRTISTVRLEDGDVATALAALGSTSGQGFVGLDHMLNQDLVEHFGASPTAMASVHVLKMDAAEITFAAEPEQVEGESCPGGYASRITLGMRMAFAYRITFEKPEGLEKFRAAYPKQSLEDLMRAGNDEAIWSDLNRFGFESFEVAHVRMGGGLALGGGPTNKVTLCDADSLSACAELVEQFDAYAVDFMNALPDPTLTEQAGWAAVRADVAPMKP